MSTDFYFRFLTAGPSFLIGDLKEAYASRSFARGRKPSEVFDDVDTLTYHQILRGLCIAVPFALSEALLPRPFDIRVGFSGIVAGVSLMVCTWPAWFSLKFAKNDSVPLAREPLGLRASPFLACGLCVTAITLVQVFATN